MQDHVRRPKPTGRSFVKGRSGSAATQFKPGQSGNPHGRPKGSHAAIGRLRIPAVIRKSLKLPLGATYGDVIALAAKATADKKLTLKNRTGPLTPESRSQNSN